MISLSEGQQRILALGGVVETEIVPLARAAGRWAAQDVTARRTQPARDLSAMDGYALRHADWPGPWTIIGESAAGASFAGRVGTREAVRIFTGAALPQDADTVIMQEDVARAGECLRLTADLEAFVGKHVRRAGEDFQAGQTLIQAGERLTAARIALAAMGGHGDILVHRPVRVALLSSGDELVPPGGATDADHIPASNAVMLDAILRDFPCDIIHMGIISDNKSALCDAFRTAATQADIILSTGGASVGDHDHVKPALEAAGAVIDFWKIAMRPGKPLMAGTLGKAVVLGLPGNPVSAFVTATLFALPLVRLMAGAVEPFAQRLPARLASPLPAVPQRTDHVRAIYDNGSVTPVGLNDSAALRALSLANALIVRVAGSPAANIGDAVEIILLA
jgi:molybdopterin molybdotransferase